MIGQLTQFMSASSLGDLARRFTRNSLSYAYAQVVTVLAQIVVVPFYLRSWGAEKYGDWLVLSGIPIALTLLDLGVTQASASRATVFSGRGDWVAARRSLHTGTAFTVAVGTVSCAAFLLASMNVDWPSLLKLSMTGLEDARMVMAALACYVLANFLCGPLDSWFRVIDRTAEGAFLLANRRLLDVFVSIVVLTNDGSMVALAWALVGGQAVAVPAIALLGRTLSSRPVMGVTEATVSEFAMIWRPAIGHLGMPIAQTIVLQGGVQVLNQISGPAAVVTFSLGRTLMRMIVQFGAVISNALRPEISRLVGRCDYQIARDFTARAAACSLSVAVMAYVALTLIGPSFVSWWSGAHVALSSLDLALIGAHAVVSVAWFVPASLLMAINRHARTSGLYLLSSLVALLAWVTSSDRLSGSVGAALLLLVPEIVVLTYVLWRVRVYAMFDEAADAHD